MCSYFVCGQHLRAHVHPQTPSSNVLFGSSSNTRLQRLPLSSTMRSPTLAREGASFVSHRPDVQLFSPPFRLRWWCRVRLVLLGSVLAQAQIPLECAVAISLMRSVEELSSPHPQERNTPREARRRTLLHISFPLKWHRRCDTRSVRLSSISTCSCITSTTSPSSSCAGCASPLLSGPWALRLFLVHLPRDHLVVLVLAPQHDPRLRAFRASLVGDADTRHIRARLQDADQATERNHRHCQLPGSSLGTLCSHCLHAVGSLRSGLSLCRATCPATTASTFSAVFCLLAPSLLSLPCPHSSHACISIPWGFPASLQLAC